MMIDFIVKRISVQCKKYTIHFYIVQSTELLSVISILAVLSFVMLFN